METFNNGQITLYQADCRDVFLLLSGVDCLVTDPAYKVISGGNTTKHKRTSGVLSANDGKIFEHNDIKPRDWIPLLFNVMRDPSHLYIMTNFLNLREIMDVAVEAGLQLHNLLVWKKNTVTPNRWYMKDIEYTVFARKGPAFAINDKGSKTCQEVTNTRDRLHPTEKPVELMRTYITNSTTEGDLVLDPFLGSGTTAIAAIREGCQFVGIEKDPVYYRVACERIEKELSCPY
jgi:DNA modification methylase